MDSHSLENLTRVLQASISPVALVSGVGLIILSQTNRLGRVMDRLRNVLDQRRQLTGPDAHLDRQVTVLQNRAEILRGAVSAAVVCVLLASVIVLLLFATAAFGLKFELLIIALFAASLLSLIVSLILFILDMNLSLKALQEELLR